MVRKYNVVARKRLIDRQTVLLRISGSAQGSTTIFTAEEPTTFIRGIVKGAVTAATSAETVFLVAMQYLVAGQAADQYDVTTTGGTIISDAEQRQHLIGEGGITDFDTGVQTLPYRISFETKGMRKMREGDKLALTYDGSASINMFLIIELFFKES